MKPAAGIRYETAHQPWSQTDISLLTDQQVTTDMSYGRPLELPLELSYHQKPTA